MQEPLVSICCQTYNHEKFIGQCLDGFLMQETNFPFEIILGEDCSSDNTREICKEYASAHPDKIKLFLRRREDVIYVDGTPTGRFNFISNVKAARGKYIALCEGDDYFLDPNKLQKQVDFLESNPDYSMCFTRFKTKKQIAGDVEDDTNKKHFKQDENKIDFDFDLFGKGWHVGTQTLMFRRNSFDVNIVSDYKYFRDVHLFSVLLNKGRGACLNFFGAVYRIHDGGIYSSLNALRAAKIASMCYKELYLNNKHIDTLKKKYYHYHIIYVSNLVRTSNFGKAFWQAFKFWIEEKNYAAMAEFFLKVSRRIPFMRPKYDGQ